MENLDPNPPARPKNLRAWKRKFYPISAEAAAKGTWAEACLHSLRKWIGMQEHLRPRGTGPDAIEILDIMGTVKALKPRAEFHAVETCALCVKAIGLTNMMRKCSVCPLARHANRCENSPDQPFALAWNHDNPLPLIQALEKTYRDCVERGI